MIHFTLKIHEGSLTDAKTDKDITKNVLRGGKNDCAAFTLKKCYNCICATF